MTLEQYLSASRPSSRAGVGLAIKRGEVKISHPTPAYNANGSLAERGRGSRDGYVEPDTVDASKQERPQYDTWRNGNDFSSTQTSQDHNVDNTPLDIASNMARSPSRQSLPPNRGVNFKTKLKRVFSSKKDVFEHKRATCVSDSGHMPEYMASRSSSILLPVTRSKSLVFLSTPLRSQATSPELGTNSPQSDNTAIISASKNAKSDTEPDAAATPVDRTAFCGTSSALAGIRRPATAALTSNPVQKHLRRKSRSAEALLHAPVSSRPEIFDYDRASQTQILQHSTLFGPQPSKNLQQEWQTAREKRTTYSPNRTSSTDQTTGSSAKVQAQHAGTAGLNRSSQEERLNILEVKLFDLEYALANIRGAGILKPDLPRLATSGSGQDTNVASFSQGSSPDSNRSRTTRAGSRSTHRGSKHVVKVSPTRLADDTTSSKPSRSASIPQLLISPAQYRALLDEIESERSSRKLLEMQLDALQKEVKRLHSARRTAAPTSDCLTPGSESAYDMGILPHQSIHRTPRMNPVRRFDEVSRFSITETESDSEVESPGIYTTTKFGIDDCPSLSRTQAGMF